MTLLDPTSPRRAPAITPQDLDQLLTAQLAVAWAGEGGEEPRLSWWRSDLTSEFGGHDLFKRLLPNTWDWAALQAAREAARRKDAELRAKDHSPDLITSLFCLGFTLDELADARLQTHKRAGLPPTAALPGLDPLIDQPFHADAFLTWLRRHGDPDYSATPLGRQLKGEPAGPLGPLVQRLLAALTPLAPSYPLPHLRGRRLVAA